VDAAPLPYAGVGGWRAELLADAFQFKERFRRGVSRDRELGAEQRVDDLLDIQVHQPPLRVGECQGKGVDHALEADGAGRRGATEHGVPPLHDPGAGHHLLFRSEPRIGGVGHGHRHRVVLGRRDQSGRSQEQLVETRHPRSVGRCDHEHGPGGNSRVGLDLSDQVDQFRVRRMVVYEDEVEVGGAADAAEQLATGTELLHVEAEAAEQQGVGVRTVLGRVGE